MPHRLEKAATLNNHIGSRIRHYRNNCGLSRKELACKTGVSYQQIHKYESGRDRISAGRLGVIAAALGQPVQAFYEGAPQGSAQGEGGSRPAEEADDHGCAAFAQQFRRIRNPRFGEAVRLLIRALAD